MPEPTGAYPPGSGRPAELRCTRCGDPVTSRTPNEGLTQRIRMGKTTVTWRLRFSRFHWRWLPENPADRVRESYATLDLCDWCAGDVFLFAQGQPRQTRQSAEATEENGDEAVRDA
jgi:hypothetical protein